MIIIYWIVSINCFLFFLKIAFNFYSKYMRYIVLLYFVYDKVYGSKFICIRILFNLFREVNYLLKEMGLFICFKKEDIKYLKYLSRL